MRSRANNQLHLPPVEVRRSDSIGRAVVISDNSQESSEWADVSAQIIDEAFALSGLESKDAAERLRVSVSLVDKWRSRGEDRSPSFVQILQLGPAFGLAMIRVMNRRFGYGRALLRSVLDAAGDLALAVGLE